MKRLLLILLGLIMPSVLMAQVTPTKGTALTLVGATGQNTAIMILDLNNSGGAVSTVSVGPWLANPFVGLAWAYCHLTGTTPTATVTIQGTNDPNNTYGGSLSGPVTLYTSTTLTANDTGDAGQLYFAPAYIRYNVTAISGTTPKLFISLSGLRQ